MNTKQSPEEIYRQETGKSSTEYDGNGYPNAYVRWLESQLITREEELRKLKTDYAERLVEIMQQDKLLLTQEKELAALRQEIQQDRDEKGSVIFSLRSQLSEAQKERDEWKGRAERLDAQGESMLTDIETGFMEGAYARLKNLQQAERERDEYKEKAELCKALIKSADVESLGGTEIVEGQMSNLLRCANFANAKLHFTNFKEK